MIELKNISLYFFDKTEKHILKNISWHIQENENWILYGKNGSGKTKLLEIIAGYLYPSMGEVIRFASKTFGNDIRDIRKRIGYISISLKDMISKNESTIDVILSGLYASIGLYVEPSGVDISYAHELLDTINMNGRANDKFNVLSDGEKQKILMLRASINQPELLLFDEPTMGLDLSAREDLLLSIDKISRFKKTSIIFVTHHIEEITPLFSRILIIENGECYFCGDIDDAINDEILSSLYKRKISVTRLNGRYFTILN
ncbi:MAG: hypothetical protein A2W19_08395 [Spirochaetes bacterium RBG_16_49_21]|nr:MAG: hypothetical protein A2W19_08395 [Spirochaetes bacterium RBG_16_49_21]